MICARCERPRRITEKSNELGWFRPIEPARGWRPQFDDLATIVAHALDWERTLPRHVAVEAPLMPA